MTDRMRSESSTAQSRIRTEWLKCAASPAYFATNYVQIHCVSTGAAGGPAQAAGGWTPFKLWPAQIRTLACMAHASRLVVLKARQLGLSWLALSYALWLLDFRAPSSVLLFSLKEAEAVELLDRLRGMYRRLPHWLQARGAVQNSGTRFELSTGSRALAFSTRGGRSYSGSLAIVDEADFIPDLAQFLNAVKPTVDGGGQLFLISTSDKRRPLSPFKNLFRAASNAGQRDSRSTMDGAGAYEAVFLPWQARPDRDEDWYARTKAEMFAQRGSDDDFFAEYPATAEEALAPLQLDRRIPYAWIKEILDCRFSVLDCPGSDYAATSGRPAAPTAGWAQSEICGPESSIPALPGLAVYVLPETGREYVIGADPAEGNPHSDDSAATVLDASSGEECASLAAKIEPTVFAGYLGRLARWYNGAAILPERNNHGHTVIAALRAAGEHRVLCGHDGKPGWLSNSKGKTLLYNALADAVRDMTCALHSAETASQIASIEASSLRAAEGLPDDRADSFALAVAAAAQGNLGAQPAHIAPAADPLADADSTAF